jgi:hypothetical protein
MNSPYRVAALIPPKIIPRPENWVEKINTIHIGGFCAIASMLLLSVAGIAFDIEHIIIASVAILLFLYVMEIMMSPVRFPFRRK